MSLLNQASTAPPVPASALVFRHRELDRQGAAPEADPALLDELVERVVERIEERVVNELERRGRRGTPGVF